MISHFRYKIFYFEPDATGTRVARCYEVTCCVFMYSRYMFITFYTITFAFLLFTNFTFSLLLKYNTRANSNVNGKHGNVNNQKSV